MINNSLSASDDRGYSQRRGTQPIMETQKALQEEAWKLNARALETEGVGWNSCSNIYGSVGLGKALGLMLLTSLI